MHIARHPPRDADETRAGRARWQPTSWLGSLVWKVPGVDSLRREIVARLYVYAAASIRESDFLRAEVAYKAILGLASDERAALDGLLALYRDAAHLQPAVRLVDTWLRSNPDDMAAHCTMFELALDLGDLPLARGAMQAAVRTDPHSAMSDYLAGQLARQERELTASTAYFRSALEKASDYHAAMISLSISLADQHEKAEAICVLERAVERFPDAPYAYQKLAGLECFDSPDDPRIVHLTRLADKRTLPRAELMIVHSTLGKVFESFGQYDLAFHHFRSMNELSIRSFSLDRLRSDIDGIIGAFPSGFITAMARLNDPAAGAGLVFIVGMPRSGSTLVEQILASHPKIRALGESRVLTRLVRELPARLGARERYPACVRHLDRDLVWTTSKRYLDEVSAPDGEDLMIVDKTLDNYMELGLIAILFPGAKVIHCRRNPLDNCLSCFFQNFNILSFSNSLRTIGMVYREYQRVMAHWRAVLPTEIHEVDYEAMVGDADRSIRRLLAACSLPWSSECLGFHRANRVVSTCSVDQVKRPIYTNAVGRWKFFRDHLAELIEIFPEHAEEFMESE